MRQSRATCVTGLFARHLYLLAAADLTIYTRWSADQLPRVFFVFSVFVDFYSLAFAYRRSRNPRIAGWSPACVFPFANLYLPNVITIMRSHNGYEAGPPLIVYIGSRLSEIGIELSKASKYIAVTRQYSYPLNVDICPVAPTH